jgi:primosomal protein N' (replication factor Y)
MITTGLDIEKIGCIWVVLLEQELQIPGYDTEEKVYTNIKQLLWRGGRKWESCDFVIQTYIPQNEFVAWVIEWNYKDFFSKTLQERKIFWYPPYKELATITYRHLSKDMASRFISLLKNKLELIDIWKHFEIILSENVRRKYNQYYFQLFIKWTNVRNFIGEIRNELLKNKGLTIELE